MVIPPFEEEHHQGSQGYPAPYFQVGLFQGGGFDLFIFSNRQLIARMDGCFGRVEKIDGEEGFIGASLKLVDPLLAGVPELYLLWLVAYLTAYPLIARIRQVAEHANVPDLFNLDPRLNTRTTIPRWFERPFLCPNGVNYHVEHHLLASVPCHKLKALHYRLREKGFYAGYEHTLAQGYWDVIKRAVPEFDKTRPAAA